MEEIIYINDDASPPSRREESVRQLCKIGFVCPVKFGELDSEKNERGTVLRIFRFQVRMTSYGSSVEFEIRYGGKSLGEQKVDVQFEEYQPAPSVTLSGIDLSRSAAAAAAAGRALSPAPWQAGDRDMSPIVKSLRASRPYSQVFPDPETTTELGGRRENRPFFAERRRNLEPSWETQLPHHGRGVNYGGLRQPHDKQATVPPSYPRSRDGGFLAELDGPQQPPYLRFEDPAETQQSKVKPTVAKKRSTMYLAAQKDAKPEKSGLFSRFKKH
jgi:hypothetical protein